MGKERERGKGENLVLGNDVKEPFREPQTNSTLCLAERKIETIVIFGHTVRVTLQISIRDHSFK